MPFSLHNIHLDTNKFQEAWTALQQTESKNNLRERERGEKTKDDSNAIKDCKECKESSQKKEAHNFHKPKESKKLIESGNQD